MYKNSIKAKTNLKVYGGEFMAKKNQQSSWNSKHFEEPKKNTVKPVPEIQGKKKH